MRTRAKLYFVGFGLAALGLLLAGCMGVPPVGEPPEGVTLEPGEPVKLPGMEREIEFDFPAPYVEGRIIVGYTEGEGLHFLVEVWGGEVTKTIGFDYDKDGSVDLHIARVELPADLTVQEAFLTLFPVLKELGRAAHPFNPGDKAAKEPPPRVELEGPPEEAGLRALAELGVVFIQPEYIYEIPEPIRPGEGVITQGLETKVYDPTADLRPYQWGLDVVNAEAAWTHATGEGIVVAVIDSGVDGEHPDLQGKVITGYHAGTGAIIPPGSDSDTVGHGTHVAGIIAAKDDGRGVVGLAHGALIMPIVIFDPNFVGVLEAAEGIMWAVDHGANVLNNSWGGPVYDQVIKAAFDYALANGVVVVASAGNSGKARWDEPEGHAGVISVAAATPTDRTTFSDLGSWVSVIAPGENILSCVPDEWTDSFGERILYEYWGGTSMAAPFVSALAALILEEKPGASPYQVKEIIEETAIPWGEQTEDFDIRYGHGMIQADAAVVAPLPPQGAGLRVHVITLSSKVETDDGYDDPLYDDQRGDYFPVVYADITLIKDGRTLYHGQTDLDGWAFFGFPIGDYWDGRGLGYFPAIEPGTYTILIGGKGPPFLGGLRTANRVTAKATVTLEPGEVETVVITVNTELKITMEWRNGPADADLDLYIYEPWIGWNAAWIVDWFGSPTWGDWCPDVVGAPAGTECYTLRVPHADDEFYRSGVIFWDDGDAVTETAEVRFIVEQNGVTEIYDWKVIQEGEALEPAFDWFPDEWWDWSVGYLVF